MDFCRNGQHLRTGQRHVIAKFWEQILRESIGRYRRLGPVIISSIIRPATLHDNPLIRFMWIGKEFYDGIVFLLSKPGTRYVQLIHVEERSERQLAVIGQALKAVALAQFSPHRTTYETHCDAPLL